MFRNPFAADMKRGSILATSVVLLLLMLIAALSMLSSATLQRNSSLSTGNSVKSFQRADSGTELILYRLYREPEDDWTLGTFAEVLGANCDGGIVEADGWKARFYALDDSEVEVFLTDCDAGNGEPGGFRRMVTRVKVEGDYAGTSRFVETSVMSQAQYCLNDPTSCRACSFENRNATPTPLSVAVGASVRAFSSASVPYGGECESETRTCEDGFLTGTFTYGRCDVSTAP